MKKTIELFLLAVVAIVILSACGASKNSQAPQENSSSKEYLMKDAEGKGKTESEYALTENKKIIKNAKLDVEASNVRDTYQKILDQAKQNGGYEFSQNLSMRGGYNVIEAKIKIAPQHLDAFITFIGECSDIINCNVSAEDITAQYLDADLRLKSMRASLDSYYKLLANANNVDEILKVQKIIDEITAQIEATQGKLNLWDKQVDESTVTLSMREKSDPVKVSKQINWSTLSFRDMGWIMRNGFFSVSNFIVTAVQWIIIIVVSILPLILIAGVALWFIKKRTGRK